MTTKLILFFHKFNVKMKEFIVRIHYVLSGEKMQAYPCPLPARC